MTTDLVSTSATTSATWQFAQPALPKSTRDEVSRADVSGVLLSKVKSDWLVVLYKGYNH